MAYVVYLHRGRDGGPSIYVVEPVDDDQPPSVAGITEAILLDAPLDLPESVRDAMTQQYKAAAAEAPDFFSDNRNDEDALSGSFGTVIRKNVQGQHDGYAWSTSVKKVRGRGKGAGEKRYGADMSIEVEVEGDGKRRRKTLLAQAKKEWDKKDAKLGEQAAQIAGFPGGGVVIDYRPGHYRGVLAEVAAHADGDAREVPGDSFRDLGEMLGDDFLRCKIGSPRVYYAADDDIIVVAEPGGARIIEFAVPIVVRTVAKLQDGRGGVARRRPGKRKRS